MGTKALEQEIAQIKNRIREKEGELERLLRRMAQNGEVELWNPQKLTTDDISRFGGQLMVPQFGVKGQLALKGAAVLVVGVGGLGCPAALYLLSAGVGHVGILDYDHVELNNLPRQVLHAEAGVGQAKVHSAGITLRRLNSKHKLRTYHRRLSSQNALEIMKRYDVVLDATHNVATRYLLNDACVLLGRPLVSGSALQFEGQLTVYNYKDGPCYRCLFPVPPPPDTVMNCGDGGVLGVVPGVVGILQAAQAINMILQRPGILAGSLLLFDGSDCSFRNIRLQGRNPACDVCGEKPKVTALIDYEKFCGVRPHEKYRVLYLLGYGERITAMEYRDIALSQCSHILVDVRPAVEFDVCHLDGAINIPLADLSTEAGVETLKSCIEEKQSGSNATLPVYVVCRRGNDSQRAVVKMKESVDDLGVNVQDVIGGLHSWAKDVDRTFPIY